MADGPVGPHSEHKPPEPPSGSPGKSGAPSDARGSWAAFAMGPHGSPRRTSAIRGLVAAIVVLVIGLPLAIALPGGGTPTSRPPVAGSNHKGKPHCARAVVAGGEKPPAVQPSAAPPGASVFAFGPTLRVHGDRPAAVSRLEVWLNTDEPDTQGTPLGSGPVELLATEKLGHDCTFATSFSAPRLPSGRYEIRMFAFTNTSKRGWEELGGRTLTIERHPGAANETEASTFAADFLLARLDDAGGAAKVMLSKAAHFPKRGERGALFAKSYRSAKVTSVHSSSKGTYRVGVRITTADGPPVVQTLELGRGTSLRADDLTLVVTGVLTMALPVASSTSPA